MDKVLSWKDLDVWVEGHEETKKMIRLVDIFAEDI